jgi:hypothetical protein
MTASPTPARWLWLLAALLLGFAVLVHNLEGTALWSDEGWTIAATDDGSPLITVRDWVAVDVHPPLFFIGLNGWRVFTGETILEMRYFSVLISAVGMALAYALGRSLFSPRAGALAALFYGLHDLVKVLTQEVRHYSAQLAVVMLALWLYWRFWQKPTRGRGIAFALGGAALLYTHYWGGFILLAAALHALITRRGKLRPFVFAFGGIGLLFAPWLPVLYSQITLERPGGLPHALDNTREAFATLIYQLVGIPELFWIILAVIGGLGVFVFCGERPHWRRWLPAPNGLLLLLAALLTPALSILLNVFYPTLSFRSLAVIVPVVIVLAAHGLSRFRAPERTALVVFVVLYSLSTMSAGPVPRAPWPQMAAYLAEHTAGDEIALLELNFDDHALAYYLRRSPGDTAYALTQTERDFRPATYGDYLERALDGRSGVWVAQLGWDHIRHIRPALEERGFVTSAPPLAYEPYVGYPIELWRFDRPPQGEPRAVFDEVLALLRSSTGAHENGVTVNLLWSPLAEPEHNYTISTFVLGAGGAFANHDGFPLHGESPSLHWQTDGLYFDTHFIETAGLPPGEYQVGVQVYYFVDTGFTEIENVSVSDCSDDPDCRFIIIDTVVIP